MKEHIPDKAQLERFGLVNNQIRLHPDQKFRNHWWFLNGKEIGFGDLSTDDILRIQERLVEGEWFEGFNENHGSTVQNRENAAIHIDDSEVRFPDHIPVTPETRRKNFEESKP